MSLRKLVLAPVVFAACTTTTSGPPVASATLHVTNDSSFAIVEFHLAPVSSVSWGPNLLSQGVLQPGETLAIDTDCGTFDVLLVDEQGVDCQVNDLDLCLNDADFVIRNNTCTVFGARETEQSSPKAPSPTAATGS